MKQHNWQPKTMSRESDNRLEPWMFCIDCGKGVKVTDQNIGLFGCPGVPPLSGTGRGLGKAVAPASDPPLGIEAVLKQSGKWPEGAPPYVPAEDNIRKPCPAVLPDSGSRAEFATGAVRDTTQGKGRYDLLSPVVIYRDARHYQNGAIKYSSIFDFTYRECLRWLLSNTPTVCEIKLFTPEGDIVTATRGGSESQIQSTPDDNRETADVGVRVLQSVKPCTLKNGDLIQCYVPGAEPRNDAVDYENLEQQTGEWLIVLHSRAGNALSAKDFSKKSGQYTLTTTTKSDESEASFAVCAPTVRGCLEIIWKVLSKHSFISGHQGIVVQSLKDHIIRIEVSGDRNWEKGMPLARFLDSALRHLFQLLANDQAEDHAAAVRWNVGGYIHTLEMVRQGKLPASLAEGLPFDPIPAMKWEVPP